MAPLPVGDPTQWRLAVDSQSLIVEEFDDGAVVFNPNSWDTHLLSPVAAYFLLALRDKPATSEQLGELLADPQAHEGDTDLSSHVSDAMESLVKVGLVAKSHESVSASRST